MCIVQDMLSTVNGILGVWEDVKQMDSTSAIERNDVHVLNFSEADPCVFNDIYLFLISITRLYIVSEIVCSF